MVTVSDLTHLTVTIGVPEAQASQVKSGQPATVTFDALPGVTAPGTVTSVAATSTTVSNVVEYEDTVTLTVVPPTVKPGMTTSVSITTATAQDAVEVPSVAITTTGTVSTVTVLANGVRQTRVITTGLRGTTETQVTSGLSAGDVVVLPSVTVSSGTTTSRTGAGAGFGLGGLGGGAGGFGGGGLARGGAAAGG